MIYKVSYVVVGKPHLGAIVNLDSLPRVGDRVSLDDGLFKITEVIDLTPPRGDFIYLHATCKAVDEAT